MQKYHLILAVAVAFPFSLLSPSPLNSLCCRCHRGCLPVLTIVTITIEFSLLPLSPFNFCCRSCHCYPSLSNINCQIINIPHQFCRCLFRCRGFSSRCHRHYIIIKHQLTKYQLSATVPSLLVQYCEPRPLLI
jgi:hypothetical protein